MKKYLLIIVFIILATILTSAVNFETGIKHYKQKQYEKSEKVFRELSKSDPEKFQYKYYLALSLINQDDLNKFRKGVKIILNNWGKHDVGYWNKQYDINLRYPFGKTLSKSAIVFCEGLAYNNPYVIRYGIEFQTYFKEVLYDGHWGQWRDRCTTLHNYLAEKKGINLHEYRLESDIDNEDNVTNTIIYDNFKIIINSESHEKPLRIAGAKLNDRDIFLLSEMSYGSVVGKLYLKYFESELRLVENKAFKEKEYIIYQIKYGPIKAGYSTMTIPEIHNLRGHKVFHCVSEARTTKFFDFTYSVRNSYESFFDVDSFASLKYKENSNEAGKKKTRTTYYNTETLTGKYKDTIFGIAPNAMDVLTALYYVRTQNISPGMKIEVDTTSGAKNYKLIIEIYEGETLKTKIGKVETYLVIPRLKFSSGVFRAKGELRIWMTKDKRHIPVKMSSKVVVGSFEATIIDYSDKGATKTYDRLFK
ncbi:DUF3108 domain-containing protein [Candidatus Dependentiae bacterium]|nr:DUF3108 domain-containing protein [Candidatus Dependentiae bacterium]